MRLKTEAGALCARYSQLCGLNSVIKCPSRRGCRRRDRRRSAIRVAWKSWVGAAARLPFPFTLWPGRCSHSLWHDAVWPGWGRTVGLVELQRLCCRLPAGGVGRAVPGRFGRGADQRFWRDGRQAWWRTTRLKGRA